MVKPMEYQMQMKSYAHHTFLSIASTGPAILTVSPPKPAVPIAVGSPASQVLDDTTRKREVRLMKNRCASCLFELHIMD